MALEALSVPQMLERNGEVTLGLRSSLGLPVKASNGRANEAVPLMGTSQVLLIFILPCSLVTI
jgi:hypothetical protein